MFPCSRCSQIKITILILNKIQSVTNSPGRSAIDPKIMLSLWIYALIEGIGSARVIDRYCSEHLAFKWICGGVSVNYHSISDFRKNNSREFDELVTVSIARYRKTFTTKEKEEIRASTTDSDARKMKMSNGGYSPAYNVQLAVDTNSRFIVGHDVIKNLDSGQLSNMFYQLKSKYNIIVKEWLMDKGYLEFNDLIKVQKNGCKVYVNPSLKGKKDPNAVNDREDNELGEWRRRMGTKEAKEIYKDRASNSEWANAGMRNRGLLQLLVRGLNAVKGAIGLHVLTHNITRAIKLNYAW